MKPHEVDMAEECQSFRTSLLRLIEALSVDGWQPIEGSASDPEEGRHPLAGEPSTS